MTSTSIVQSPDVVTRPSIIVDGVSKHFLKRNTHSFKEAFIGWIKGKKVTSDQFLALDDVSFQVAEGESVAILGLNGSGKSTTLKLISGVLQPDSGHVFTRGRVAGLIEVGAGFHPELSGRENVYLNAAILGMKRKQIEERFDEIVAFSEIGDFIDQEVKHYSSGMFMRLAFAVAIHVDVDVLLVDEVLSVGDAPFRAKCARKIKELTSEGVTMLVVSHDVNMVKDLCSRGVVMSKGKKIFEGPIEEAVAAVR
ncbi:ABC transporter ATP-binding protein [Microbacterium sp. zg.Y1090]|uniref:ABC transporter ATP-binding protein n=1 Tax=Microbacterium wangruii TaxID=3049073 RepID=UPI00214C392F|nr:MULTISPECIES: ABC transporter ATP-binding protein [unclassified Microbacterium]MCR2818056.1 ABC transporter ATP-binding protein [Microbacterium sp. zg.Y1090]WIM27786.1 ABC transporter ATP-binding protein [Microbacterium sp. zg-Y1090]